MKYVGKHKLFDDLMIGGVLLTPPDPATYAYELTLPNDDGTSNQVLTTDGNGVLTWTTVSSGTTYSAGDGLDLSGTTFSTDIKANSGLVIDSTELSMDLGASSITGTLAVGDGGTGATSLTDNAILSGTGSSAITAEDTSISSGVISRSGTIELAGTTVTLDSAGDIELEVGAVTNYVDTDGIFRGYNVGSISDGFIPLMPIDFAVADSFRQYGSMGLNGHFMAPSADRNVYVAQKIIPRGYTASSVVVNGLDANGNATYRCYVGDITGTTPVAVSSSTALNSVATFSSNIVGDGSKYCTIVYDPGDTVDVIYGGKINIAKT